MMTKASPHTHAHPPTLQDPYSRLTWLSIASPIALQNLLCSYRSQDLPAYGIDFLYLPPNGASM